MTALPFHALSFQHLVTLGIIALICFLLAWKAREGKSWKFHGWLLGFVLLGYAVVLYVQQGREHALSWQYSLPLGLCNLVLIACIISLFRPNPFTTEIAYYWGFGGVLQATVTPDILVGFPSWEFFLFFWSHGVTLMAIVFLIARREFRPRRGSILRMMIVLNVYALTIGTLDAVTGWNYGFLCRKPSGPSLFDVLGPWPWYLLSLEVIAFLTFFLLDLPWQIWKYGHSHPISPKQRR
jgi:hypothetical integral membrane protein (TIGR02206 family)